MSLDSETAAGRAANPPARVKQLYLRPPESSGEPEFVPHLFFEAKIDLADIRSGFHGTFSTTTALELTPIGEDELLTDDMFQTVNPEDISSEPPAPAKFRSLPAFLTPELLARLEKHFLVFLMRRFKEGMFRNYYLNVYSYPSETREDFENRCAELMNDSFRRELDAMRGTFNRRLEQLRQKYCTRRESGEFDSDRIASQKSRILHGVLERITELFLETRLTRETCALRKAPQSPAESELEQRLDSLEATTATEAEKLRTAYLEKAHSVDEYIIHPNLKDLHLVRTCILWMPAVQGK